MPDIALFQPDIPQNTGTILRLAACLDLTTHIIGPVGFDMSDRALRRAALDYIEKTQIVRHASWQEFVAWRVSAGRRLVLLTTRATKPYTEFQFDGSDILLFGRESAGAPAVVHEEANMRLRIPIRAGLRSLNLAVAVAMVAGEALRQMSQFPEPGVQP